MGQNWIFRQLQNYALLMYTNFQHFLLPPSGSRLVSSPLFYSSLSIREKRIEAEHDVHIAAQRKINVIILRPEKNSHVTIFRPKKNPHATILRPVKNKRKHILAIRAIQRISIINFFRSSQFKIGVSTARNSHELALGYK